VSTVQPTADDLQRVEAARGQSFSLRPHSEMLHELGDFEALALVSEVLPGSGCLVSWSP